MTNHLERLLTDRNCKVFLCAYRSSFIFTVHHNRFKSKDILP